MGGSNYASQKVVFDDLGMGVLKNAYDGYNTSLFAYGQTGSGKSYSMIGYGENKGIVPITCEELFKKIERLGSQTKNTIFDMYHIRYWLFKAKNFWSGNGRRKLTHL